MFEPDWLTVTAVAALSVFTTQRVPLAHNWDTEGMSRPSRAFTFKRVASFLRDIVSSLLMRTCGVSGVASFRVVFLASGLPP